jgi:asparagine synthase (glutamine-hydrolysing)
MCGIAGYSTKNNLDHPLLLENMIKQINHRGPTSSGISIDQQADVYLAHARLAILELSPAGAQPMKSDCSRYEIIFNGEIYNHLILRKKLENELGQNAHSWKGHSDTETLLKCFEIWGISRTLQNISGMFAIVLFDKKDKKLFLMRDRFGEKPLYYGQYGKTFIFASELKSFKSHPNFVSSLDSASVNLYFKFNCIPAPHTIYKETYKLKPGHLLVYCLRSSKIESNQPYWNALESALAQHASPFKGNDQEALEQLDLLLTNSIQRQMLSDVPLGAFLSGGIDSSLITAVMQKLSEKPIKTFSIGFEDKIFDESEDAMQVANRLGTEHYQVCFKISDSLDTISKIPDIYDEPFSDSSQIPTYFVSKLAKQQVTVSLTGDGGDEIFCGYNHYQFIDHHWRIINKLPHSFRKLISKSSSKTLHWMLNSHIIQSIDDRAMRYINALPSANIAEFYRFLNNQKHLDSILIAQHIYENETLLDLDLINNLSVPEFLMLKETVSYLSDDLLTKVDRASMSVSLETRAPFLNEDIFNFAWSLPLHFKLRKNQGKWCLRQLLQKYLPEDLVNKPKKGFSVPIDSWIRNELKDWCYSLIKQNVSKDEFLNASQVFKIWDEHQKYQKNHGKVLWSVVVYLAWKEKA